MPRRGLGQGMRGLDALIPSGEDAGAEGLREVSIDAISPNPYQPRGEILETKLEELANSIREVGIIQPLIVTATGGGRYQLIAGERRWRAARLAGLDKVPVVVKEAVPQAMLEMALVENVQRADLNPMEEADAYQHLVEDFGMTQQQVADRVGKNRSTVANLIRLLSASEKIKEALQEGRISVGHGRALLGLDAKMVEAQDSALKTVLDRRMTVRETEAFVKRLNGELPAHESAPVARDPHIVRYEERFNEALGFRVDIQHGKKEGRVVIHYYNDEDFQTIFRRITGEDL